MISKVNIYKRKYTRKNDKIINNINNSESEDDFEPETNRNISYMKKLKKIHVIMITILFREKYSTRHPKS